MMREIQASMSLGTRGTETSRQKATRSIRLDFPKLQGIDPEGWIFQAEEYFLFHGIMDDSRIQIVDFHMTKGALSWMHELRRNNLLSTWDKFKEDIHERFRGSDFDDKLQQLSHIQQTSSITTYLERFEELLNEVTK